MMKPREGLLERLGLKRPAGRRPLMLEESLHAALVELARQEGCPPEQLLAGLLVMARARQQAGGELLEHWQKLSPREQDVTAFTCLGYTNRQIAAKLNLSPDTVRGYVRQVLVKFQVHSKFKLQAQLQGWDFCKWGPPAPDLGDYDLMPPSNGTSIRPG
jgi:DNA-binding CsgD family transcriptional regulator